MSEIATPSQTVGPFFHIGLDRIAVNNLTANLAVAEGIVISGHVLDGDGKPVIDALIEVWQADAHGAYASPRSPFKGFGRIATDAQGAFSFTTVKPGRVAGPNGKLQAPHIAVNIFMRGLLKHLVTRIYFPDEPSNDDDAILQSVSATRRATLIGRAAAGKRDTLTWNIMLQGEHETVFFDC
jgi:protocatechuate 3,4-dioxygenase, alpha subunit